MKMGGFVKKHEPNLENGGKERPGSFERLLKAPDRVSASHPTDVYHVKT